MEQKTARLTILIDPGKKKALETLCAQQDLTPSQLVRRLIRDHLSAHGVSFEPGGGNDGESDEAAELPKKGRRPMPKVSRSI